MTEEKPFGPETLHLSFDRMLCSRHGETFRASWPLGMPSWMLMAFKKYGESAEFGKAVEGLNGKEAHNRAIEDHLDEKPLCCRLDPEDVFSIWIEMHQMLGEKSLWKRSLCYHCKKFVIGGPYQTRTALRGTENFRHLCLRCILFKMKQDPGFN